MCLISASMGQYELQDKQPPNDQEELLRNVQGLLRVIQSMLDPDKDTVSENGNAACRCTGLRCQCCQRIRMRKIKLDENCCLTVMYLKRNVGFLTTFVCGKIRGSKEISLRNPLPICVGIPYLTKGASICLQLNDLRVNGRSAHGCATLLGRLFFVTVVKVRLGCFNMNFLDQQTAAAASEPGNIPELSSYEPSSWIGSQQDPAAVPVFEDDVVMMESIGQPL